MVSAPIIDEQRATETTPLPNRYRARRLVALYFFLALIAVVIGIAVGVHRYGAASIGQIAAPTEQSIVATAQPGLPTPTPLATKVPSPTPVPPTEPPPTAPPATLPPPTPIPPTLPALAAPVRSAPVVNGNQNGQHDNGKGNGKGKGHTKGD